MTCARWFAAGVLCVLLGGCGPWIGDPVVEVIGEVTLDRKVLTGAKVVFVPMRFRNDEGLINPLAFGETDGTGRFELRSDEQKGVLLGRYRVLIFKANSQDLGAAEGETSLEGPAISFNAKQNNADEMALDLARLLNEPLARRLPVGIVPEKYNLYSELEYVVDLPVGIVYPKFDLTSE
jgi:hypothetical protein